MIYPYNGFKDMDCSECGAEMWIKSPFDNYKYLKVCAIAYNGGGVIVANPEPPKEG